MKDKKLNILVTGGNGQLGRCLRDASKGSSNRYIFSDINEFPGLETLRLDICNPAAVDIVADSEKVDVIVNCAGYTNVDKSEDEPELADQLNHIAAANLASSARRCGAVLIHISTDYIFGGSASTPITEDADPSPLGVYGATKLAGERSIRASACKHIIIRTAWLYSKYGRNFARTMFTLTANHPSVKVVNDQTGTPTYGPDLARFIVGIIDGKQLGNTGTYNFTDEGVCSWYDFASEICSLAGHNCKVAPCRTSDYPTKARRPHYS
ncbi:MAG: dTDP-4-dehydrorhamnose reductase, partial [Bacteroidales bacterium]|nr:dTDP-4-dehydrorhamnose reductase [Bacteroidales bacterium]